MLAGTTNAKLPQPQQVLHPEEEACAADAADKNGDLHIDRA
ncbi:hypothetical protein [Mycobacterium sp. IDR2000157661]|nr:hypothetical protein [Mycobacterium sp. IDR2000157661]